jgi:hypothetical protein
MPATQSQSKFTVEEAQRFAALMAGFDTGNPSQAEADGKGRALRRMASAAGMRVIDVLELQEIRQAIDEQMQPVRHQGDVSALQAENEDLRARLAVVVPKVTELAEALKKEKEDLRYGGCFVSIIIAVMLVAAYHFFDGAGVVITLMALVGILSWFGKEQKL